MVTVVVPTLAVGDALEKCLNSLELQTLDVFDVVVVDNSGAGRARAFGGRARVIVNQHNAGFAGAVNQGIRTSRAVYVATLNDDAIAEGVDRRRAREARLRQLRIHRQRQAATPRRRTSVQRCEG